MEIFKVQKAYKKRCEWHLCLFMISNTAPIFYLGPELFTCLFHKIVCPNGFGVHMI